MTDEFLYFEGNFHCKLQEKLHGLKHGLYQKNQLLNVIIFIHYSYTREHTRDLQLTMFSLYYLRHPKLAMPPVFSLDLTPTVIG